MGRAGGGGLLPTGPNEIFGLDLTSTHLSIFCALFDFKDELLFLPFEFLPFAVELALGFFESPLVLEARSEVSA